MKKKNLSFIAYGSLTLSLVLALLFLFTDQTFAASLLFTPSVSDGHVGLHQMFKISVQIDVEDESINALETHISYPKDLLRLSSIEDGSSFLTMWLERAHDENGIISLSGIVPKGFSGKIKALEYPKLSPGDIVTLVFEPIKAGTATVSSVSSIALINDGLGTKTTLKYEPSVITIGDYENKTTIENTDVVSPDFIYAEAHHDATLGGEYLFFEASDKDSGIDHYEIKNDDAWQTIQSPYLIKQNVGVYYIKAVDRVGNEKIKEVRLLVPQETSSYDIFWLIVVMVLLLMALVGKRVLAYKK